MRIASTQFSSTMNDALQTDNNRTAELMQQMSSGNKLLKPSDDPIGSVRLLRLNREDALLNQYGENIGTLKSRLSQNEAYLDTIKSTLLQARDLVTWAADGSNTKEDLESMSHELSSLRDALLATSNTKDQEGRYLFSGTATTSATVHFDSNAPVGQRYSFTGNTEQQPVVVGNGITQPANISLNEMSGLLNRLDSTIELLQSGKADPNMPTVHNNISASLSDIDATLNSVSGKVTQLGGYQNTLETLSNSHTDVKLAHQHNIDLLSHLDYASAYVELNGYTLALQATQKAYGKVSILTLFNAI